MHTAIIHVEGQWYLCTACGYGMQKPFPETECERPNKPRQRRERAIGMIVNYWAPFINGDMTDLQRDRVVAEILLLHKIGRSERWLKAIERWVEMLNKRADRYALLQGAINTNHAA